MTEVAVILDAPTWCWCERHLWCLCVQSRGSLRPPGQQRFRGLSATAGNRRTNKKITIRTAIWITGY